MVTKTSITSIVVCVLSLSACAEAPDTDQPATETLEKKAQSMFRKLNEKISVSPQITLADVDTAKAEGVTLIVNNRPDGEDPSAPQSNDIEAAAKAAGIDGLIIVDMPPEADDELCLPAMNHNINFIRLATPTTDDERLPKVLQNTSGFVYYVSVNGITGTAEAQADDVAPEVARIKAKTDLPVIVGFGIKTPAAAEGIARIADGAVVGSAIVDKIGRGESVTDVLAFVKSLADGTHRG